MPTDARASILSRIQAANGGTSDTARAKADWEAIKRTYVQSSSLSPDETVDLLEERLLDYGAHVTRCTSAHVRSLVGEVLAQQAANRLVVPVGFPFALLPDGVTSTVDTGLSGAELDHFDAAITECAVAIAETGTLVLLGVAGQGRRATSLVPDLHLCVLRARDVVATVPEAWARLAPSAALPMTLISGPSATSDIEMTRIQGVHGPRRLYVFLLSDSQ